MTSNDRAQKIAGAKATQPGYTGKTFLQKGVPLDVIYRDARKPASLFLVIINKEVKEGMDKSFIEEVSRKTGISVKELNRLNRSVWYHGTTVEDAQNIIENGVDAYYNVGKGSDYGPGFYLTAKPEDAERYISTLPIITSEGECVERTTWAVLKVEFNPFELLFCSDRGYRYKNFPKYNDEFADFAIQNWLHNAQYEYPRNYDIIWGVESDSIPDKVISDYVDGIISYDEAKSAFKKSTSMKQLCIANPAICSSLKPIIEKEVK